MVDSTDEEPEQPEPEPQGWQIGPSAEERKQWSVGKLLWEGLSCFVLGAFFGAATVAISYWVLGHRSALGLRQHR